MLQVFRNGGGRNIIFLITNLNMPWIKKIRE